VIAVFQPHLYSRTRDFYKEFGSAFYQADLLIVTDVYPAREQPIEGVSGKLVADAARELGHRQVHYIDQKTQLIAELKNLARPGDIIITLGAGDIYKIGEDYLNG
jgi:UDP-N-acetylmuramate--alanine ligase